MSLAKAYSKMKKTGHKMAMGGECTACGGGMCKYADGGEVKGVHKTYFDDARLPADKDEREKAGYDKRDLGESRAGVHAKAIETGEYANEYKTHNRKQQESAVEEHHKVLGEMKAMPKPKLEGLAEGGEVGEDGDHELMDQCCGEFIKAIESKNKKEILESLKAIILSMGE